MCADFAAVGMTRNAKQCHDASARESRTDAPYQTRRPTSRVAESGETRRRFRTLFLSDLHLGSPHCQAIRVKEFLDRHEADTIYLAGDIFDARYPVSSSWTEAHHAVVATLLRRAAEGTRLVYIPGNHDEAFLRHGGAAFDAIRVEHRALHEAADGRRYVVLHGDCFDVVARRAKWLAAFGGWVDAAIRAASGRVNRARRRRGLADWAIMDAIVDTTNQFIAGGARFGRAAAAMAREHGADGIICGHFHRADLHGEFGVVYANCGDWVDSCTAIAETGDGDLRVIAYKPEPAAFGAKRLRLASVTA